MGILLVLAAALAVPRGARRTSWLSSARSPPWEERCRFTSLPPRMASNASISFLFLHRPSDSSRSRSALGEGGYSPGAQIRGRDGRARHNQQRQVATDRCRGTNDLLLRGQFVLGLLSFQRKGLFVCTALGQPLVQHKAMPG